jgi:hypothetical protein
MPPELPEKLLFPRVSESMLAAIGAVATQWSLLEFYMDRFIWALAGVQDVAGACLTAQVGSLPRRLDAIISLVRLHGLDGQIVAALNKFAADSEALSRKRNRIVHDTWSTGTQSEKTYRLDRGTLRQPRRGDAGLRALQKGKSEMRGDSLRRRSALA